DTLRGVDVIACEDTRHTLKLLNHFGIQKPMTSYHEFNEDAKAEALVRQLERGTSVALVSDAGTPAISDPGYRLVRLCRKKNIPVISIPGPNAAIAALAASGLPSDEFVFLGFLPSKKSARRERLGAVANISSTLILHEAPHRIEATLEDLQDVLGDREICVAREVTKVHEEFLVGKVSDIRPPVTSIATFV